MSKEITNRSQLVLIQKQTAWKTPKAVTDSGYVLLNVLNAGSVVPEPDVLLDTGNFIAVTGVSEDLSNVYVDPKSGLAKVPFSGIASLETLAYFFRSIAQQYEELEGYYQKTFDPLSDEEVIDFTTGATLYTLLVVTFNDATGGIAEIFRLQDAIISDFEFSVEPTNRGFARMAKITGSFVGTDYSITTTNVTLAAYTTPAFTKFNDTAKFTLNINTSKDAIPSEALTDICYKKFVYKYTAGIQADCRGAGGVVNNFKLMPKHTMQIDIPYLQAAKYNTMLKNYVEGKSVELLFYTGTDLAVGYLSFAAYNAKQDQNPLAVDGEYWKRPLSLRCFKHSTYPSVRLTLTDNIELG